MTVLPFASLGIGLLIGIRDLPSRVLSIVDAVLNVTLVILMLTIGMNIGINHALLAKLDVIGINCLILAFTAILLSVLFTWIAEKTILPLERIKTDLMDAKIDLPEETEQKESADTPKSPLVFLMPASIISGVLFGYFLFPDQYAWLLGHLLTVSLILLYIGVGISLGSHRKVFRYVKVLGLRILFLPLAILIGSLLAGFLAGVVLHLPFSTSVLSVGGMSYYSLTGAYMTQWYGLEAGTYGFLVNVIREFLTVVFLPLLIKISKGSPIASGASGNMDTMLMPITKFVGPELGLVTLITGSLLTFFVPILLPLLTWVLGALQ